METITKEKIAEYINQEFGLSQLLCEDIISDIFDELIKLAEKDGKISIKNFGTFSVNSKHARPGVNLNTMKAVEIEARNVLSFVASKKAKEKLNKIT